MCAFLIVLLYLFVEWRYKLQSLSVFLFPLVFVMSLVATFGNPVGSWPNPVVGGAWLTAHIALALLGYAALALMALASLLYLVQERALKSKKPRKSYPWLPALGMLDEFIARSMGAGFALITLAVITASIWAFIEHKTAWISQPGIAYLVLHLGRLSGPGLPAHHRRMARPQSRLHDRDRAGMLRRHLGCACAVGRAAG